MYLPPEPEQCDGNEQREFPRYTRPPSFTLRLCSELIVDTLETLGEHTIYIYDICTANDVVNKVYVYYLGRFVWDNIFYMYQVPDQLIWSYGFVPYNLQLTTQVVIRDLDLASMVKKFLPIVKYIHKMVWITTNEAHYDNCRMFRKACSIGNLPFAKYLHKHWPIDNYWVKRGYYQIYRDAMKRKHYKTACWLKQTFQIRFWPYMCAKWLKIQNI